LAERSEEVEVLGVDERYEESSSSRSFRADGDGDTSPLRIAPFPRL
jgi:hypothetical protein